MLHTFRFQPTQNILEKAKLYTIKWLWIARGQRGRPEKARHPTQYSCPWKPTYMSFRLQSMGLQWTLYWATSLCTFHLLLWEGNGNSTQVFLPRDSQDEAAWVATISTGLHRVGDNWSDLAAAKGRRCERQSTEGFSVSVKVFCLKTIMLDTCYYIFVQTYTPGVNSKPVNSGWWCVNIDSLIVMKDTSFCWWMLIKERVWWGDLAYGNLSTSAQFYRTPNLFQKQTQWFLKTLFENIKSKNTYWIMSLIKFG